MSRFSLADGLLDEAVPTVTPAAQLVILQQGREIHRKTLGFLDPETCQRPAQDDSLFDLASVTKLFVSAAFMRLVEQNLVSLETPVCAVLPEFSGMRPIQPYEDPLHWEKTVSVAEAPGLVDASQTTFRQLLVHNSGLPAWRLFKDQPDAASAQHLALETFFSYPPESRIVYSDVGLILLGMAVSRLTGEALDQAVYRLVTLPLGLSATRYRPTSQSLSNDNVAPTEFCSWRGKRIVGEVHDESAWRLGGVAGHAGLFSNATEVAAFGQSFLSASLLRPETIAEMTRLQAEFGATRRGIGFALWSPDPEASGNPFSPLTYGHTGFTGTCVWIDPQRSLVVALLTNDVYYGRQSRGIGALRVKIHRAIVQEMDAA